MCQAGLTNNKVKWENWEWDEEELTKGDYSKNFFLTMEHFGLSIPFLFQAILNLTFTFFQYLWFWVSDT